ncbi:MULTISPECIES: protease modulator HflC [Bosea]|uniref:protease modulator HflC n=1 Tax=Bosea TaxID=85413 RepID=UPI002150341B|nr:MULTISPECIES: protease modulator HflC [Bosea]MCR4523404.1 protease modulator HflC [Bosea sp. 47.2.35]MDR6828524.1 membrane protease subunit HflC [Bosea robiniae]MDR6895183.1 membrane protease subunit HflC [Bosea sp. BE109]MDR7138579.1 membrane protease subunit HflC [Bosea sp. BE168]MDR7175446.1 membrane protease subunit HflC [Bosea sp. BE271]
MNSSVLRAALLVAVIAAAVVLYACTFVVSQTQSALVLRLGAVRSVVTAPGLYFKLPAPFEQVTLLDNRILDLDLPAQEIIASDQKRLVVDAFTRYRISDPLRFYQAVNNIPRANSQLASIVNGNVRSVLAEASFIAMVRTERSRLMNRIRDDVNREAARFGMTVVDVRLRRVDLPAANSAAVFQRMQTERQREAAEARALGGQQAQEVRARADRDATVIVAEAQQRSDVIRGEGEAERNKVFAEAFGKDPEFFAFYRSMQAYEASIKPGDTRMVLTPDSPFFRFFNGPSAQRQDGQAAAAATPAQPAPARP